MAQKMLDVVGIGNAIVDVIARADDAFLVAEGIAASTAHHTKNFLDHHPDGLSFARSLRAIGADQPRVNHTPVNLRKVISALGEACTMNYHIGFYYLERP